MEQGFVVWFTGLPGSGKTTLAQALERELRRRGIGPVERLDGDTVRQDLTWDLGFSKEDRDENIRRVSFVAALLARNGVIALCAFVSPYREARRAARARAPRFVEVYCRCPLATLIARDPKGMYKKALAGEVRGFTGIDDPYEEPEHPEVVCDTDRETPAESAAKVIRHLEEHGLIAPHPLPQLSSLDGRGQGEGVPLARDPLPQRGEGDPREGSDVAGGVVPPHGGRLVCRLLTGREADALRREAEGLPQIPLSPYYLRELRCLATGVYSPLTGFLGERAYRSVVETMRLPDGTVWPLPIVLPVEPKVADALRSGGLAVLAGPDGAAVGILRGIEVFTRDPAWEAHHVFGTDDPHHPGVARVLAEPTTLVGGEAWALDLPAPEFPEVELAPEKARAEIVRRGWRTVAAFQTRNPLHRAHEYLLRCALEVCDGLLLSPLMGETQAGDVPAQVRLTTYRALVDGYFPRERVFICAFPANMRYAGPREAVFHALCRKNFGATHFVVGRDHAGVGSFYGPYEAQQIFDRFAPDELGIIPLKFRPAFWCRRCGGMATEKTCPHPEADHLTLSGTELRAMLREGKTPPAEVTRPEVARILAEAMR
ncbi:MAG: sulfate adenylyltransferase [Candidatus Acetothermia bacterium]|nr:sulfate adenylyltransferase [Candidatus Acetothermia bacterium]